MEKNDNEMNIGLFGNLNSGKCSLSKMLTIVCGNISSPNFFKYEDICFNILPIACHESDYREKFDLSSNLCDIAILLINASDDLKETVSYLKNVIVNLLSKNVLYWIICINKIDLVENYKDFTDNLRYILETEIKELEQFYNFSKLQRFYIQISVKEEINITKENKLTEKCLLELLRDGYENLKEKCSNEKEDLCFKVTESYTDEDTRVLVGKIINGSLNIGDEICLMPGKSTINVNKICKYDGKYWNKAGPYQFVTIKGVPTVDCIPVGSLALGSNIINNFYNFKVFEAEIFVVKSHSQHFITAGLDVIVNLNGTKTPGVVKNILGQTVDGKNIQAKFIKIAPKLQAKVVIEMESIVCSSKYEMDSKSGYLSLGVGWEENLIAIGKILRLKPIH